MTQAATEAFQRALLDDDPAALYERAPCGYLSTTPDGTIVKANQTFLTWTGYAAQSLIGRCRLVDLLTPGGKIYHETHYNPLLHAVGEVKEIALDMVRADGGRIPVLLNAVLDRTPAGEPRVARIALFDATDRRRYEQELLLAKKRAEESERRAVQLAQTLQQTLIPPRPPRIPGLQVATAYRPAGNGDEVGGDFYDVFQIGDGDWVATLGDVSGKGAEAAVVTSLIRHTVRARAVSERSPGRLLHQLNAVLLSSDTDRFCTIVLLRLHNEADAWRVTSSVGGHPRPLVRRRHGSIEPTGDPGPIVGAFDASDFPEDSTTLTSGDSILLYTDGVTEARHDAEFFGEDRLLQALVHPRAAEDIVNHLLQQALNFQRGTTRDDIAMLALTVPG